MTTEIVRSISLFCTEGTSNKEYHVELARVAAGFVVNFRYGARGKALKAGTKTDTPVSEAAAAKIYDRLVAEKTAKGYTADESGAAYTGTPDGERDSGWRPALLTPVDEEGLDTYLDSEAWVASEKKDGERRALEIRADGIAGINRKGLYVPVPEPWTGLSRFLLPGTLLDGEHVGDRLYVFDCVRAGERDLRGLGYAQRLEVARSQLLEAQIRAGEHGKPWLQTVAVLPGVTDPIAKRSLLQMLRRQNAEGLVFRRGDAPYEGGVTPGSVKFKFVESATCIVRQVNPGKRSVALALLDARGAELPVGNVTIPANHDVPSEGALVEVRYMHMFEGGSLYQPVYLGVRTDLDREAATLAQVRRVKAKGAADADEGHDEPVRERMRA